MSLKECVVSTFKEHVENWFFTLKFSILDYLFEDIERLNYISYLDASTSERSNIAINSSYGTTSMWHSTHMEENINNMGGVVKRGRRTSQYRNKQMASSRIPRFSS